MTTHHTPLAGSPRSASEALNLWHGTYRVTIVDADGCTYVRDYVDTVPAWAVRDMLDLVLADGTVPASVTFERI